MKKTLGAILLGWYFILSVDTTLEIGPHGTRNQCEAARQIVIQRFYRVSPCYERTK